MILVTRTTPDGHTCRVCRKHDKQLRDGAVSLKHPDTGEEFCNVIQGATEMSGEACILCRYPSMGRTDDHPEPKAKPQPHSELREMLANITPLPWDTGACMTSVEVRPNGWRVPMCVADFHADHAPDSESQRVANAQYAVHCANLFPKLLAAAEAFEKQASRYFNEAVPVESEVWNAMTDAIAEAHGQVSLQEGEPVATPASINADLLEACKRLIALGKAGADTSWQSEAPGVQDTLYRMMCAIREHSDVKPVQSPELVIEVKGGCVVDVRGLAPGQTYTLLDRDNA